MQRKVPKLLEDIRQAAHRISEWSASRTLEQYRDDPMLRSAVERNFEVVGEAINRLARADADTARRLGPYEQIIAFRNILIHGYDIVEHDRVWHVIRNDVPDLLAKTDQLLREVAERDG